MPQSGTMEVWNGTEVEVDHIKPLEGRGARFDIEAEDGRKWRVDVTQAQGGDIEIVTTWRDGQLADLDEPDWLEDVMGRLTVTA